MSEAENFLTGRGWYWVEDADGECGAASLTGVSGWCPRPAHWYHPFRAPMCAAHAKIRERFTSDDEIARLIDGGWAHCYTHLAH